MEIVLRATAIFVLIFLLTRGIHKRALSDMSPFEMILLITLGDLVQQAVTQNDMSVTGAVLAMSALGFWATVLSWATWRWSGVRRVVEGVPVVLVTDGEPDLETLKIEQIPIDEVMEAARQQGVERLDEIRLAVLEASGRISIIQASSG